MATYEIPIENIEELRKKAASISKKAVKYGVTIVFEEVGETVKEIRLEDGSLVLRKYIVVEAEGEAKANGWMFVGTIEHTECGNILRSIDDEHKIPERYRDAEPFCEHCKTRRARKDTYVVYNEESGEFKQVGKSCLKEYTRGLSVEMASLVLSWLKDVEDGCSYTGSSFHRVFDVKEVSKYFVETIRKLGWVSSASEYAESTKTTAMNFYDVDHGWKGKLAEPYIQKMAEIHFDADNTSDEYVESALAWAKSYDGDNDYRINLKVIARMTYCEWKHLGYLASLYMAYEKDMEREVKRAARAAENAAKAAESDFIGNEGDKLKVAVKSWKTLTSWDTQFGVTYLYEFVTEDGNVLVWKTSKWLDDDDRIVGISGTVKAHNEFRGVKQTELTRCKVTVAA